MEEGVDGLLRDKTSPPGRKPLSAAMKRKVLSKTALETPPNATHLRVRSMAREVGIRHTSAQRIWAETGLNPHLVARFKISNDPNFEEIVTYIVGFFMNTPDRALVLCVDEKSQIQALNRTQPGLPLKKGRCGTLTHDYKRHGTTTLFAALEVVQGKVVGQCQQRHRNQEFLKFLATLDQEFPGEVPLHLVLDNYGSHKHPNVQAWLERHPRFICHFVPTSCSWLNLIERWFGELTSKRVRRGSFFSVGELQQAIQEFLAAWNEAPRPFVWSATVTSIMTKLARCRQTLEQSNPGAPSPETEKTSVECQFNWWTPY